MKKIFNEIMFVLFTAAAVAHMLIGNLEVGLIGIIIAGQFYDRSN